MVRTGGGEPVSGFCSVEIVTLVRKRVSQRFADIHHALMRPKGLIGREKIDIGLQRGQVGQPMGGIAHPINAYQRTRLMGQTGKLEGIVEAAENVRAMGKTHKRHLVIEQVFQILPRGAYPVPDPFAIRAHRSPVSRAGARARNWLRGPDR